MLPLSLMECQSGKGTGPDPCFPSWNTIWERDPWGAAPFPQGIRVGEGNPGPDPRRSRAWLWQDPRRSSFAGIIVCFALKRIDSGKLIRTIWKRFHEKAENPIKLIKPESILNNSLLPKNVETGNCVQIKLFQSNTAAGSSRGILG